MQDAPVLNYHSSSPETLRDSCTAPAAIGLADETPIPEAQASDGRKPTCYVWKRPKI